MSAEVETLYNRLVGKAGQAAVTDLKGDDTSDRLANLAVAAKSYLATIKRNDLESKVPGKSYLFSPGI